LTRVTIEASSLGAHSEHLNLSRRITGPETAVGATDIPSPLRPEIVTASRGNPLKLRQELPVNQDNRPQKHRRDLPLRHVQIHLLTKKDSQDLLERLFPAEPFSVMSYAKTAIYCNPRRLYPFRNP
jgi:hypothetical protein